MAFSGDNRVLNERWLNRAAWWVRHREQLKAVGLSLLIFLDAVVLIYSSYWWLDYYVLSASQEAAMYQELSQPTSILSLHGKLNPIPLAVPTAETLPGNSQSGTYDALVKFLNPNPSWVATLRYRVVGDTVGAEQTITLLNESEQFALAAGVSRSPATGPRVEVLETKWMRLRDPSAFNGSKPNFTVSDVRYQSASDLGGQGNVPVSQVRFTAANESTSGFWSVSFMVIVKQGARNIAAQEATVDQFRSGEQREVVVNFFGPIGGGATALVVPYVNVADETIFMRVPGEPIQF